MTIASPNGSTPQRSGKALDQIRSTSVSDDTARVRATGFRLLLDRGAPVEPADVADAAGLDFAAVQQVIAEAAGRVEIDDEGRLLGIAGLTVSETQHEIMIGDQKRWTWCALDAVGILGALGATGTIRSTDPRTGAEIRIGFVDGRPDGDATLFILGEYGGGNMREDWCPMVNFFNSQSDAEEWVADHDVTGDIVSVRQVANSAAAMWQPVTNPI